MLNQNNIIYNQFLRNKTNNPKWESNLVKMIVYRKQRNKVTCGIASFGFKNEIQFRA